MSSRSVIPWEVTHPRRELLPPWRRRKLGLDLTLGDGLLQRRLLRRAPDVKHNVSEVEPLQRHLFGQRARRMTHSNGSSSSSGSSSGSKDR